MTETELLKIIEWATSNDTGVSSIAICRWMLGIPSGEYGLRAPSDAADRGRCIRLLNKIPQWWDRLDELAALPGHEVTFISKTGIGTRKKGWAQQIPLIKNEGGRD